MKRLFIILLLIAISTGSYAFEFDESVGGTATALGGVILDKDFGAFNVLYNPNMITMSLESADCLSIAVSYAEAPYGLEGIDNSSFGVSYAHGMNNFILGYGIGGQMRFVDAGISEYTFYIAGSFLYTGIKDIEFLKFIDSVGFSVNLKPMFMTTIEAMKELTGYQDPSGLDADLDMSFSMFNKMLSFGLTAANILDTEMTFFGSVSNGTATRALVVHLKFSPIKNFTLFGSYNLSGSDHLINKNNFLGSSTALANTYFGVEGSFSDSLFVRIGVNEGRLSGGIGLEIEDFSINVGIQPIPVLNMYYQVDLSYKFDNLFVKTQVDNVIDDVDNIEQ